MENTFREPVIEQPRLPRHLTHATPRVVTTATASKITLRRWATKAVKKLPEIVVVAFMCLLWGTFAVLLSPIALVDWLLRPQRPKYNRKPDHFKPYKS